MIARGSSSLRGAAVARTLMRRWNSSNAAAPQQQTPIQAATPATPAASGAAVAASTPFTGSASAGKTPARRARDRRIMLALVAFGSVGFLFPFYLWFTNNSHHYTGSKPLTPAQRIRGAYINSSTRDIGPDPEWQKQWGIERVEAKDK